MPYEAHNAPDQLWPVRTLLPIVATIIFVGMVAIAEHQIRSSPQWPPPLRHEVGGWHIDDPPLWTVAAGVNLPATVPILWMSAASDDFTYAIDDHHLIIYAPWTIFVFLQWYFVAYHFDRFAGRRRYSATRGLLAFAAQIFITAELIYCAIGIVGSPVVKTPTVVAACFWAWVIVTLLGWINLVKQAETQR